MKRKFLAVAAAVLVSFGFSGAANADCNGIYLGGRVGTYKPKLDKDNGVLSGYDIGKESMTYSAALGYRYDYVRAELEFVYREKPERKINLGGVVSREKFEATSYMFNVFYDLSPFTMFTPYLGAGVGMSDISFKIENVGPGLEVDENNFTWNVGGGISAKVTTRFNIDLGYRYWDFGKLEGTEVTSHEFYGGLRYVF